MFWRRETLAEAIGTFILVFAGTGAVMVNQISNGAVTHLGVSLVFGAIVGALIYSFGYISGAHFNPAVTLAFWASGFFPRKSVGPYILPMSGICHRLWLAGSQLRASGQPGSNLATQ